MTLQRRALATACALVAAQALAADIVLAPPAGSGVSMTDSTGATVRFRVGDDGAVTITTLSGSPLPARGLCLEIASGRLGSCGLLGLDSTFAGSLAGSAITSGTGNTAFGADALKAATSGAFNTAVGTGALRAVTTASGGTAVGYQALATTTGVNNTAVGYQAAFATANNGNNTATGYRALFTNGTGGSNTANGASALFANTTGAANTALGTSALGANTTGSSHTAVGDGAMSNAVSSVANSAFGQGTLQVTTGNFNTALGSGALQNSTGGSRNTAAGFGTLVDNTTGNENIAIGYAAGGALTTGSFNIAIGNAGVAAEANTIRIGNAANHTRTFLAGVRNVATGSSDAVPVFIDSAGQLGTINSSRRYKDDIADMDDASDGLLSLRPVTFRYRSDAGPGGRLQYGLVAEEVADVYPGLVARAADGQAQTVLYQFLPPMLLNEYQKQQRTIDAQAARIGMLERELLAIKSRLGID